jgi:hypothetical protein
MDTAEEVKHLHALEQELQATFPDIPADKVNTAVEHKWLEFLHAPIRDYVPLLVKRQAIDELRHLTAD